MFLKNIKNKKGNNILKGKTAIVAVTGASGFLGRHIVSQLLSDGYNVRCLVRNKSRAISLLSKDAEVVEYSYDNINSIRRATKNCDVVIHSAAIHSRKISNRDEIYKVNIEGTEFLLRSIQSLEAFVFISSIRSMMTTHTLQIDEDIEYNFSKYDTPYGLSKYMAEKLCLRYYQTTKLSLYIINPAVIICPEDWGPSYNGKLILEHLYRKVAFVTKAMWNIVDVRDVAKAIPFILEKGRQGERHIVCSGNMLLKDFFLMIDQISNCKKVYISLPYFSLKVIGHGFEMMEKIFSGFDPPMVSSGAMIARLMSQFSGQKLYRMGFRYRSIKETISDTIEWVLNNKQNFVYN